jgi:hypothetical protein
MPLNNTVPYLLATNTIVTTHPSSSDRVLPEKLTVPQLVKKFAVVYEK